MKEPAKVEDRVLALALQEFPRARQFLALSCTCFILFHFIFFSKPLIIRFIYRNISYIVKVPITLIFFIANIASISL